MSDYRIKLPSYIEVDLVVELANGKEILIQQRLDGGSVDIILPNVASTYLFSDNELSVAKPLKQGEFMEVKQIVICGLLGEVEL